MKNKGKFVVILEIGDGGRIQIMTEDEDGLWPSRFDTALEARKCAEEALWAKAWVWWVVELATDGTVQYGLDVE